MALPSPSGCQSAVLHRASVFPPAAQSAFAVPPSTQAALRALWAGSRDEALPGAHDGEDQQQQKGIMHMVLLLIRCHSHHHRGRTSQGPSWPQCCKHWPSRTRTPTRARWAGTAGRAPLRATAPARANCSACGQGRGRPRPRTRRSAVRPLEPCVPARRVPGRPASESPGGPRWPFSGAAPRLERPWQRRATARPPSNPGVGYPSAQIRPRLAAPASPGHAGAQARRSPAPVQASETRANPG